MNTLIGWDTQDITPLQPVELIGQYYQRVSTSVRDPLSVTALAIEQITEEGTEQAVMVSIDIVFVIQSFLDEVREAVGMQIPDLDSKAIILNATHTHSAPNWFAPFRWWVPAADAMPPDEVHALVLGGVVRAVVNAWKSRQPGQVASASAHVTTGFCRRMLYADGQALMYGETDREDFTGVEAGSDPLTYMLFTWDAQNQLTGVIANVACPAQVMEAQYVVTADYFGELRKRVHAVFGPQVHLLGQVSAAGCQSPRNLPSQAEDEINYWNEQGMLAIAERLSKAITEGYESARQRMDSAPVFKHAVSHLELPVHRATLEQYQSAREEVGRLTCHYPDEATASRELFAQFVEDTHVSEKRRKHGPFDNKELDFVKLENAQAIIRRYESQDAAPTFPMELHALRIGECAIVTNPFELYLDYGQMICGRSRAKRTFVVELACDCGGYLPTARAMAAGGYSAFIINGSVGPQGGRLLVDRCVSEINRLWDI